MTQTKYYCDICKKEISLPLHLRIIKKKEPVRYEILGVECCEPCVHKISNYISELREKGGKK